MAVSQLNFSHFNLQNKHIRCFRTIYSRPANIKIQGAFTKFKLASTHLHISCSVPEDNLSPNVGRLIDFIPGRSWWNLDEADTIKTGNPITVWYVVNRIWRLVADDKLVIYIGLCSLTFAALSEISIPSLLAASIFAAQNGEALVLYRNLKILTFLCFASGICSTLRFLETRFQTINKEDEGFTNIPNFVAMIFKRWLFFAFVYSSSSSPEDHAEPERS